MPHKIDPRKARRVELIISVLLRTGVVSSLTVIVAGTVLSFVHHPKYLHDRAALPRITGPDPQFPRTAGQVVDGLKRHEGRAVVVVGLILLMLTPVARVAVSVAGFIYERDPVFVALTALVLALLILSFALGKASG